MDILPWNFLDMRCVLDHARFATDGQEASSIFKVFHVGVACRRWTEGNKLNSLNKQELRSLASRSDPQVVYVLGSDGKEEVVSWLKVIVRVQVLV